MVFFLVYPKNSNKRKASGKSWNLSRLVVCCDIGLEILKLLYLYYREGGANKCVGVLENQVLHCGRRKYIESGRCGRTAWCWIWIVRFSMTIWACHWIVLGIWDSQALKGLVLEYHILEYDTVKGLVLEYHCY